MTDHSARITITTFPDIQVLVYPSTVHPGWWYCKAILKAVDVQTGEHAEFEQPFRFKLDGEPTQKQLASWVRECVISQLVHELDEGLTVDGERVYDPHKEDKWPIDISLSTG